MEKLKTVLKKEGHLLRQVWRDNDTAIYSYNGGYEVIVIKKLEPKTIFGREYPAREGYPSGEDWGSLAITRPESDSLNSLKERAKELFLAQTLPEQDASEV